MNRTADQVLVSTATICILMALHYLIGSFMGTQAIPYISIAMIIVGFVITFFGDKILDGNPSMLKSFLTKSVGLILLVGGINFLMEHYNELYWWVFLIIGVILYNTHHLISERL